VSKILICDDESKIREIIKKYAVFSNYEVVEAENGLDALQKLKEQTVDLIIMDIMMPELDGFSTVKEIRKKDDTPVIMLSAKGEEYDKIHGFEIGIDDYVVKPFSGKELMMRVEAVLKRVNKEVKISDRIKHEIFEVEGLKVDFTGRIVYIDGTPATMTPKEYDLFFYFIKNRNIALSREKLISEVWGYDFLGYDRTLDTHIKLLRKSLGKKYSKRLVTLRGVGYRFDAQ